MFPRPTSPAGSTAGTIGPVPVAVSRSPSRAGAVAGARAAGPPPEGVACRAPWTSLHLDQRGDVRPCCQSDLVLGNVGERSVVEVWQGEPAQRLRAAMAAGDLSLGCGYCAGPAARGATGQMYARRFDDVAAVPGGEVPAQLELALSNTCNLRCTMCSGEFSSAIRSQREGLPPLPRAYGEAFFAELEGLLGQVRRLELFGGEPLLAADSRRVLRMAAASPADVEVQVTTNGTVWNDELERLAAELRLSFVVSVDGASARTFEAVRVGAGWEAVRARLDDLRALTRRTGADLSISHCLMVQNWWELPDLFRLAATLDADVWINTVLSPAECSLYALPAPRLAAVVAELERDEAAVVALGERWAGVWRRELDRLRAAVAEAPPTPEPEPADTAFAEGRVVEVPVDEDLAPGAARLVRDAPGLPPLDLAACRVGDRDLCAPFAEVLVPRAGFPTSEVLAVAADGRRPLVERRTFVPSPEPPHLLRFEQVALHTVDELVRSLRAEAAPGVEVARLVLSAGYEVVEPVPPPAVLGPIGLQAEAGGPCHHPIDVLAEVHRAAPPELVRRAVDPLTERVEVRCTSGLVVVGVLRRRVDGRVLRGIDLLVTATRLPPGAGDGAR